jgi:hypothetical protein
MLETFRRESQLDCASAARHSSQPVGLDSRMDVVARVQVMVRFLGLNEASVYVITIVFSIRLFKLIK